MLGEVALKGLDLGVLGQRLALVRELREAEVEGLDVEEADLVGGRGVQWKLLVIRWVGWTPRGRSKGR
ncbi:hypothetical protein ADK38_22115 [Streptomyces varsoviensis]|uniref:Uncharacterized protein n=1 Tax=Streptomyces varsoviensis TaxID=67373 RepID=A0ABR5J3N1_9ACTN|nr:hypothetical protein ADK38_22115 [Streptomyces varsoviensis]